jgi:hypothetical protein
VGRVARGDYKKEGVTRVENKTWKGGQLRVVKRRRSNEGGQMRGFEMRVVNLGWAKRYVDGIGKELFTLTFPWVVNPQRKSFGQQRVESGIRHACAFCINRDTCIPSIYYSP